MLPATLIYLLFYIIPLSVYSIFLHFFCVLFFNRVTFALFLYSSYNTIFASIVTGNNRDDFPRKNRVMLRKRRRTKKITREGKREGSNDPKGADSFPSPSRCHTRSLTASLGPSSYSTAAAASSPCFVFLYAPI